MNAFTSKKTIAGLSAFAAAGLLAVGTTAPALADDRSDSSESTVAPQTVLTNDLLGDITGDTTFADLLDGSVDGFSGDASISGLLGDVTGGDASVDGIVGDVTGGDITGGDVSTGDVSNESPVVVAPQTGDIASGNAVGSGNDVQAPIASGNETNVDLGDVSDVADVSDVVDVDGLVGDVTGSVDGLVGDITGDLDLGLGDFLN